MTRSFPSHSRAAAFCLGASVLLLGFIGLSGCATTSGGGYGNLSAEEARQMIASREADVAAEVDGAYYIGRRYLVNRVRIWGYLRKPREPWAKAQLVVINESRKRLPDRVPEFGGGAGGRTYGYDHNSEYHLRGYYTGRDIYDPNANAVVPEFMLTGYELKKEDGGFLFRPGERYDPQRFPSP